MVECENQVSLPKNSNVVGIDLGIKNNYTLCDNLVGFTSKDNIKSLQKYEKQLVRLSKQLSRKKKDSSNWNKSRIKLAKLHYKIKSIRQDFNHKLSRNLINNYQIIVLEDLDFQSMIKSQSNFNKKLLDPAFYQLRTREVSIYCYTCSSVPVRFIFYKCSKLVKCRI